MKKITTIIADDEPPSLRVLKQMLSTNKNVRIAAECTTGPEAVRAIERIKPDLAFLDIQMPGCNGLEILERIKVDNPPITVFVTAFDEYAVKAFEANALDYILKPYDQERIDTAINKAAKWLRQETKSRRKSSKAFVFHEGEKNHATLRRLLIRKGNRILVLKIDEIDWISAAGDYIEIHIREDMHLMHRTIAEMQSKLDPLHFQRIHRSTIVNVDRVVELEPLFHLDHAVILKGGKRLTLSRTYHDNFFQVFSK